LSKNLVIVESPAKAKTITKFLGKDYTVIASMGHIRDLPKSTLGFDPEDNFKPKYQVSTDKRKTVANIKKLIDKDTVIYLASDEDREGEAIAWHLIPALKIEKHTIKRIVFHEITKPAILNAIKNSREVDQHLVDAQQARRILDRAVGYKLSPLLWSKIKFGLSAGRVQSVAVRIIVDREKEIEAFTPEEYWKIKALFQNPTLKADFSKLNGKVKKIKNAKEANEIDTSLKAGQFILEDIEEKDSKRRPTAPFTTSTLQQEASRKLGYSVKQTMIIAQQLYEGNIQGKIRGVEGGLITYMRTDSLNLSTQATSQAKDVITLEYGANYALKSPRKYTNKNKGAQEAHEAIRPVDLSLLPSQIKTQLDNRQFRLYELIWKRTIATQMSEAKIANTTYKISAGVKKECEFVAKGQKIIFDGFMRAYTEGSDNPEAMLENQETFLPHIQKGTILDVNNIDLEQLFTKPPARYTEASLVKKMESEGIGRPSTYAPTISTIQAREYIIKDEGKLKPTKIGRVVNDFLVEHFSDIIDLGFTAKVEEEFDQIAEGKLAWTQVMQEFYGDFIKNIEKKEKSVERLKINIQRELGLDPKTGLMVVVRDGRYGPFVQLGDPDDKKFASVPKDKTLEGITLDEALYLFNLPREVGEIDGEKIVANIGMYGPYLKKGKKFYSIKEDDPYTIELDRAKEVIKELDEKKAKETIKEFEKDGIRVLNGRFGAYIKKGRSNYKIPKNKKAEELTLQECKEIIEKDKSTKNKPKRDTKKSTAKKTTVKKSTTKTATKTATKKTDTKKKKS
jgi:DNA topoisomerase-1